MIMVDEPPNTLKGTDKVWLPPFMCIRGEGAEGQLCMRSSKGEAQRPAHTHPRWEAELSPCGERGSDAHSPADSLMWVGGPATTHLASPASMLEAIYPHSFQISVYHTCREKQYLGVPLEHPKFFCNSSLSLPLCLLKQESGLLFQKHFQQSESKGRER